MALDISFLHQMMPLSPAVSPKVPQFSQYLLTEWAAVLLLEEIMNREGICSENFRQEETAVMKHGYQAYSSPVLVWLTSKR